ncbi:hypothetical protein [Streptomyces sp. NPDC058653]|uniref:hypothetical protein n=1 Tax=Streptomyces sp. NPDC058653 TaxID=3346576 RepID=UPI00365E4DC2
MSSSYYVLCLSHDPAILSTEHITPGDAADTIRAGRELHPGCDLVIEEVSGGPIEIGCSPAETRNAGPRCHHRDVEWTEVEWLRLLSRAHTSTDPKVVDALRQGRFTCWPPDRLHRLRGSLGIEDEVRERP